MTEYHLSSIVDFARLDDVEYVKSIGLQKTKNINGSYILKYDKSRLNSENIDTLGLFRSVVVHDGKVVSFSPPKSVAYDHFEFDTNTVTYQEYVEGTMVNMYHTGTEWEVATRSLIGAHGNFFKGSKSFREMFFEAFQNSKLEYDHLNPAYCYSFVMQHPENRIVLKVDKPRLVLCAIYKCHENAVYEIDFKHADAPLHVDTYKTYCFMSVDEAKSEFANPDTTSYDVMGVVMKNVYGQRAKIRNPKYEHVRKLRGNQSKLQYQYLSLYQKNNTKEFLKYYPEFTDTFKGYHKQVCDFVRSLHMNYMQCYVYKQGPLRMFPKKFRWHMYTLHKHYLDTLKPVRQCVNLRYVEKYCKELETSYLMYSLNYEFHESAPSPLVGEESDEDTSNVTTSNDGNGDDKQSTTTEVNAVEVIDDDENAADDKQSCTSEVDDVEVITNDDVGEMVQNKKDVPGGCNMS
jgi:hypothetical protein